MRCRYDGPMSGFTLPAGREVLLFPGQVVELPEDNDYVKTLVALKRLTPVPGRGKKEAEHAG